MRRKKFKVHIIITLLVVFTAITVYFATIYRAESILQQLVKDQSNGELIFNVEKVKLDIFRLRFDFKQPELRTRDTSTTVTGYQIKAKSISFKAKSLIPFLIGKRIVVDSLLIIKPEIQVFKYKEAFKKKVSLPEEMGKVYKSLEKVLYVLNLNYLHIESARFKVFDYVDPNNKPVEVSRLNLTVHKVTSEKRGADNRFLFADRILFEVYNQDIVFSDGFHGIKFKQFSLNTGNQTIKLDSCYIYGKQSGISDGEYSSFVDTVRIAKLDLNLLVKKDILKMDSALCINPEVTFLIPLKEKPKRKNLFSNELISKDSLDFILKKMLGNLDIGYLKIKNAKVKIVTKRGDESHVYNTSNSDFTIEKVLVNNDPKVPIHVGRFNLDVRNYVGYSPDSLYVVRFDNIQVLNNTISLLNFRIGPSTTNHELLHKEITMEAFEFNHINWAILLYESRIVAGNVIMIKPELNFKLSGTKKNREDNVNMSNPFTALEAIRRKVQIDDILIKDGSLRIEDLKGINFSIDHINAGLNVNQLLKSTSTFRIVDAVNMLSFGHGEYRNPSIQLSIKEGKFSKTENSLSISQIIQENKDHSILAKMNNVDLRGIKIGSTINFSVDEFIWANADLTLRTGMSEKVKTETKSPVTDLKFTIGHLSGGPTTLNFRSNNIEASTKVTRISSDEIVIEGDQRPKIAGLNIDGQSFTFSEKQLKSSITAYNFQTQKSSTLNNVIIRLPANKELITIFIPRLIFSADINQNLNGILNADFIELQKPVISFAAQSTISKIKTKESGNRFPTMNIRRLTIDQPELANLPADLAAKMQFNPGKSNWNLLGLHSDGEMIKADSIRITLNQPGYRNNKIRMIATKKESIALLGSDFLFNTAELHSSWSVKLDILKFNGFQFNTGQDDTIKQTIAINSLNLENLILNDKIVSDLGDLIAGNDHFRLSNGNFVLKNNKNGIKTYNFTLDKASNSITIDSINFSPLDERDLFIKSRQYQSNYMRFNTGLIKLKDIDFNLILNDAIVNARNVTVNDLNFYNYKDKRLPFQNGIEKPLLSELIKNIKTRILFNSLLLKNASVEYEEYNDKTQQKGEIKLSKIKGIVTGIKNYDFSVTDSIKFNLYARLMPAIDLKAGYAQSYTDSLCEFQFKVIASPFDLTQLNPILKPFASARVKSGQLDTLRMSAVGNKYVTYGIMKMYYHDLKVQYLNKGSKEKTLKSRLFTFFANRIVNKRNIENSGEVYAERNPEKGFANYWMKILMGGIFTNTGVRTDNKQERKYNQTIKKYNVPAIQDIPVDF